MGNGYSGYSKSNNAILAEKDGRLPLHKASRVLCKKWGWNLEKAKTFLKFVGTKEYHHTSKFYNVTYYYDVSEEGLEDIKDFLCDFEQDYNPKPKNNEKEIFFKCWNIARDDVRGWDWKLTDRNGNNNYSLKEAASRLEYLLGVYQIKANDTHAAKRRVSEENILAIKKIFNSLPKK